MYLFDTQVASIVAAALWLGSCGCVPQQPAGNKQPHRENLENVDHVAEPIPKPASEGVQVPSPVTGSPVPILADRQRSGQLPNFVARVSNYGETAGRRLRSGGSAPQFAVDLEIESPADLAGRIVHLRSPQDLSPGDPLRAVGARYRVTLTEQFVQALEQAGEGHTIYPGVGAIRVLGPAAE